MSEEKKEVVEEFEVVDNPEDADEGSGPEAVVEDERLRNEDDDEADDNSTGRDDETPEERAERRREERRRRRERQRAAEAANKAELQRAREQIDAMAYKMQQMEAIHLRNEAREVDSHIAYARDVYNRAERVMAEAVARGDGAVMVQAARARDQAAHDYNNAVNLKNRLMYIGQEPYRQNAGPDPRVAEKARAFIDRHPWIDPLGLQDEDSAVARALDMKLQADGYDPTTDEYWDVLEDTLSKRLPHRFRGGRSGPPIAGGMDRAGSGRRQFYLSPERKKALMDSGDWDDPVRRNKMIKAFAEYDAKNRNNAAR